MDLSEPGKAELLASIILTEIDKNSEADNPPKFSWRVSPSSLGKDCVAQQWYKFRWVKLNSVDGRMSRLFDRGNKEEAGFASLLRRAGWEVRDFAQRLCLADNDVYVVLDWEQPVGPDLIDVSQDARHIERCRAQDKWFLKQWRVKRFGGHYSGYLDGKIRHPQHTGNEWILLEGKTYNTKRFCALVAKNSVMVTDYEYYCQALQYMDEHQLPYCLFIATNKNDDDIYIEFIPANPGVALHLLATAHTIIKSIARPARVAESAAFHKCKQCTFSDICHKGAPAAINCRSCQHCIANTETGNFECEKWKATIPNEKAIMSACPEHLPIA